MKHLIRFLAIAAFIAGLCCGCATAKQNAYKSLATVGYSVDSTMKAAADAKVQGKMDDATWGKIAALHAKYQGPYKAAILAAKMDYSSPAASDLLALAQAVLDAVQPFIAVKPTP